MGLLGGTVSAAGRTLGHWLSLATTGLMMGLVLWFVQSKAKLRKRKRGATVWHVFGPTILVAIAATCIMMEPFRHVFQDTGLWEECGNNKVFPRVNETLGDADICRWSSSQYKCERLCYVPGDWTHCGPNDAGCGGEINLTDPVYKVHLYNESITVEENILVLGCMNGTVIVDGVAIDFFVWDLKDKDGNYFSPYDADAKEKAGYDWITCPVGSACNKCVEEEAFCHCTDHEEFGNLSTIGWIFTFALTYLGFFLLTTGVMRNADIIHKFAKIKSQYRALRDPGYRRKVQEEAKGEVIYVWETVADNTVVVFSKTTCPFCYKAKEALDAEMGQGTYFVVELDEKENTSAIQDALKIVTGARTVPRVFINQECIGGGDDTVHKHKSGELKDLLRKAGAIV